VVTVLSHRCVQPLLTARREGRRSGVASLDLGLTSDEVSLTHEGVVFPDGQSLSWTCLDEVNADTAACFVVHDNAARKIQIFSRVLNRPYSLMPTDGAPTLLNAGFTMHRIVGIDPYQDTLRKIRCLAPLRGPVLDTTTGLGYTALEAAKTAEHVLTIELDPAVLEIARLNPWSHGLFHNPRITQIIGDVVEEIRALDDESFARIIHDPPSLSLAGELYAGAFYRHLFRVLRRGGRLFHYVGNPESRHGQRVTLGVVRRLNDAGFTRIVRCPAAFGLVAYR
jgi:predicted methyltransferase